MSKKKVVSGTKTLVEIMHADVETLTKEELEIRNACVSFKSFTYMPENSGSRDRHVDTAPKYSVRVERILRAKGEI